MERRVTNEERIELAELLRLANMTPFQRRTARVHAAQTRLGLRVNGVLIGGKSPVTGRSIVDMVYNSRMDKELTRDEQFAIGGNLVSEMAEMDAKERRRYAELAAKGLPG
jgi:hypothetical protein